MRAAALRSLADGRRYIRVTEYVMPFISLVPGSMSDREGSMFISVPIDNLSHMLFWGFWKEDAPHDPEDEQMLTSGERALDNYATFHGGPDNARGPRLQKMAGGHHPRH